MVLLWYYYGIIMVILWYYNGIINGGIRALERSRHGIA